MLDKLKFFEGAMRCLSSSIQLEESLVATFSYLQSTFPLAAITFDRFSLETGKLTIPFIVTAQGYQECMKTIDLSDKEIRYLEGERDKKRIFYFKTSRNENMCLIHSEHIHDFVPNIYRSYLISTLMNDVSEATDVNKKHIDYITFVGKEENCFTNLHKELFEMILPSFALALMNRIQVRDIIYEKTKLQNTVRTLTQVPFIGAKGGLKKVYSSIQSLQHAEIPVLIMGETGTGKELVANEIQKYSKRRTKPFVKVNCGALPESLLDSELFGFEKGAFTGANATHEGYFEKAHGGTLFLDEVGELSLQAQTRLLRVLQDGTINRIGGTKTIKVDVRIIAATNRNFGELLKNGGFREDLYHRLNVFPLHIPPLRDRQEDIPLLLKYFVDTIAQRMGIAPPPIWDSALESLQHYTWPGNVRELENLVERALAMNPQKTVDIAKYISNTPWQQDKKQEEVVDLDKRIESVLQNVLQSYPHVDCRQQVNASSSPNVPARLDDVITQHIIQTINYCRGKIYGRQGAAALLGINHSTLRSRMKKLGIEAHEVLGK